MYIEIIIATIGTIISILARIYVFDVKYQTISLICDVVTSYAVIILLLNGQYGTAITEVTQSQSQYRPRWP